MILLINLITNTDKTWNILIKRVYCYIVSTCPERSCFIILHKNFIQTGGTEMTGVLGHDSALVRLYWAADNLG